MNEVAIREKAREEASYFLKNETQYRLGMVDAEQSHPLTKHLDQDFQKDTRLGVMALFSVDFEMAERAESLLASKKYALFAEEIFKTIENGGRVIFSGCGSSGRLSMRLEQSWRSAVSKAAVAFPEAGEKIKSFTESVGSIMTGGDWAVIRAVESFEDSTLLGKAQAHEWNLTHKDLLVGVTATGETTSILGTAQEALEKGARVYMLICSDPVPLIEKLERMRVVFTHPSCEYLALPCGPMAITGSTRMQSSTFEQLTAAIALESALCRLLQKIGISCELVSYDKMGKQFLAMTKSLLGDSCLKLLSQGVDKESSAYKRGALVTLYSDEALMDVLTDTTERAPTFMTPPFRSQSMSGEPSWAFVKNPNLTTALAWEKCFLRTPKCLDWTKEKYASLGLSEKQIHNIPDISLSSLKEFLIGKERMEEREGKNYLAMWVDIEQPPCSYDEIAKFYGDSFVMTPLKAGVTCAETWMDLFEHLALKMMLNVLSTGAMVKLGRVTGNWMTSLSMSNKKLVDRSARIVSDVCGVSYEIALEEIFFAKLLTEEEGSQKSPAKLAIDRLRGLNT